MSVIQFDFEDIEPRHDPNEGRVIINRNFDRISGFTISFGSVFVQDSGSTKDIRPRVGGGRTAVANLGDHAFAAGGYNNIPSGDRSFSSGFSTSATSSYSTSFGSYNLASGISSLVSGENNITESERSAILGGINNILLPSASRSIILGGENIIGTEPDTVYGINFNASGDISASTIYSGGTNLGDLLSNSSSANTSFNGNRTVKRNGVPNINVGGDNVVDWLNNYFFPFLSASLSTSSNQTIEVGVSFTPTIQYNINLNDETIVNQGRFINVTNGNSVINILNPPNASNNSSYNDLPINPISASSFKWKVEADVDNDGNPETIESNDYTVNAIYPWFYGTFSSGGAVPGSNRPSANQSLIDSGTKVLAGSNGSLNASFNSTADDYLWFAIPSTSNSKNVWYETALNNGSIGGVVDPGGNLFPDFDIVSIDSPSSIWVGVEYKIYISNFQSGTSSLQLRNN